MPPPGVDEAFAIAKGPMHGVNQHVINASCLFFKTLGEVLDTPPPGVDEAIAIAKVGMGCLASACMSCKAAVRCSWTSTESQQPRRGERVSAGDASREPACIAEGTVASASMSRAVAGSDDAVQVSYVLELCIAVP